MINHNSMKKQLSLLFMALFFFTINVCKAQFTGTEWKVSNIGDVIGKEVLVKFYRLQVYYQNSKGKLKLLPFDSEEYTQIFAKENKFVIVGYYVYKEKSYLQFKYNNRDFFLFICENSNHQEIQTMELDRITRNLASQMKNLSALSNIVDECNERYCYLKKERLRQYANSWYGFTTIDDLQLFADCAYKVQWTECEFDYYKDLKIKGTLNSSKSNPEFSVRVAMLDSNDFYSERDMVSIYAAIENRKIADKQEDSLLHAFTVTSKIYVPKIDEDDTIYMFTKTKGWHFGEEVELASYDVDKLKHIEVPNGSSIITYHDYCKYLDRRGSKGFDIRKEKARVSDSIATEIRVAAALKRIKELSDALEQLYKEWKQKKIFLVDKKYSFGDNLNYIGLELEFFNCFNKTIKYIQFDTKAYNTFGDLQKDYFGRAMSGGKCIGPIEPGERATFDFDELYYNKNEIIESVRVTKVVFTFLDNSTMTYTDINNHISKAVYN